MKEVKKGDEFMYMGEPWKVTNIESKDGKLIAVMEGAMVHDFMPSVRRVPVEELQKFVTKYRDDD